MNKGALIFQIQDRNYAIDLLAIDEVLPMMETRPVAGFPPYMEGIILLRGESVPVVDLQKYFGHARKDWPWESRILIVTVQGQKIGFIANRVQKIQTVEPCSPVPSDLDRSIVRLATGEVMEQVAPEKLLNREVFEQLFHVRSGNQDA